ncbi:MAG: hypothetical protein ABIS47_03845 [Acidimicrobiales bacterium]
MRNDPGQLVGEARTAAGLSRRALARKAGVIDRGALLRRAV